MKVSITCLAVAAVLGMVATQPADAASEKKSQAVTPAVVKAKQTATNSATSEAVAVAKRSAQAASSTVHVSSGAQAQLDQKPGPAQRTVSGTVKQVNGQVVVMEDYEGREVRMFVSSQTKKLRGDKKPGDSIRAELTAGGHANSVQ